MKRRGEGILTGGGRRKIVYGKMSLHILVKERDR